MTKGKNNVVEELTVIVQGGERTFRIGMQFTLKMPIAGHPNRLPTGTKVEVSELRTPRTFTDDRVIGFKDDRITRFVSPSILKDIVPGSVAVDNNDVIEHHGDDSDGCGLV